MSAAWPGPVPTGRREPLHLLCDPGDTTLAEQAALLASRIGTPLMPFQHDLLAGLLTRRPDGLWTHRTAGAVAVRQSGKTLTGADLRILFGAFALRETVLYTAQRWNTARAIYQRLRAIIRAQPSLMARVPEKGGWVCSQGQAQITIRFDDGVETSIQFVTRSTDFRGPTKIDLVVYDEAYDLSDSELAAIGPTQMAARNPQTIMLSTAVNQDAMPNGVALARLRQKALRAIAEGTTGGGLYWAEWAADPPDPEWTPEQRAAARESPATWEQATPSYGVIASADKVRPFLDQFSAKNFEVELLGWGDWPDVDESGAAARVFDAEQWDLARAEPELVGAPTVAVWRSLDRRRWAVAMAQRAADGRVHVEIGPRRDGPPAEMAAWIASRIAAWNPRALGVDARNAANVLVPLLADAGVEVTLLNTPDIARGCGGWLDAVTDNWVTHSGQRCLGDAIIAARKRLLPGGDFAWVEDAGGVAGPLIAASQAHELLLRLVPSRLPARPASPSRGPIAAPTLSRPANRAAELDVFAAAF